jgi:Pex14 N-terminal domain
MSQKADKPSIPSWQRAQSTTPASPPTSDTEEPTQQQQAESTPEPGTEEFAEHRPAAEGVSLLEQASKFLEDPSIQDAPRDRKAAFLETKGLSKDGVEKLLGTEPEQDISSKLPKEGEKARSKVSSI